jgi:translocation and assembly module TamA
MGIGWQQQNNEYSFKTSYRLPRRVQARKFWTADYLVNRKNQDLEVKANDSDSDFIRLTNGDVIDYSLKLGNLIVRDLKQGYQQLFETWYGQYVLEKSTFSLRDLAMNNQNDMVLDENLDQFRDVDSSFSLGVNWDWPVVRGSAFHTEGHHERAWIFTANKAWGSTKEFSQAYVSSSWHKLLGENWKILLRGEVGYSDADVSKLELDLSEQSLRLSVTDLPDLYRFKAGGSRSVRGYGFENLSNNGIGSNNIVTGSAEVEWSFRQDWSAAAFFDVGNAFNDWGSPQLRKGAGLGIRWYSIAGPVRVDIAQALDIDGHPWQLHFTIGTPLL